MFEMHESDIYEVLSNPCRKLHLKLWQSINLALLAQICALTRFISLELSLVIYLNLCSKILHSATISSFQIQIRTHMHLHCIFSSSSSSLSSAIHLTNFSCTLYRRIFFHVPKSSHLSHHFIYCLFHFSLN